jgi:hypothetical protein
MQCFSRGYTAYRSGKKVSYKSQQNELPELKDAFPEFRNIHSLAYRMLPEDWIRHLITFTEG